MKTYTVSFFGHRYIENPRLLEKALENQLRMLLRTKEYVVFLVGRDGDFDRLVSSAIRRCKREYRSDNSAHVWVLPYPTAELRNQEDDFRAYYDEIEVCDAAAEGHFKGAHQKRNREMVDRSDLVIFYVRQERGGAWQTMKYAAKQGVPFLNLWEATANEG